MEAVVVLPVFVIIFASVFYVRNQVLSRQAAQAKARTCAWAWSMENCDETKIPPGCEGIVQSTDGAGQVHEKIKDALEKATGGLVGPVIATVLEPALKAAFGRALDASAKQSFQRPSLYGGGTATTDGSYRLACNLARKTLVDVAEDAWKSLFKF